MYTLEFASRLFARVPQADLSFRAFEPWLTRFWSEQVRAYSLHLQLLAFVHT